MSRASRLSGFTTAISGDTDLNVGIVTAKQLNVNQSFTFTDINVTGVATANNLSVTGVSTLGNVVVGGATTDLVVNGNARVTGILTVGTSSLTLNGDSSTISGINTINDVSFPSTGPLSNRNLIINGAMQVAQRGTSESGLTNSPKYLIDRFSYRRTGDWGTNAFTMSQQSSGGPDGFTHFLRLTQSGTAAAPPTDASCKFNTIVEGFDTAPAEFGTSAAKDVTLSFYARGSVAGTYCMSFANGDSSAQSYIAEYSLTTSWKRYELIIPARTTGVWYTDNSIGFSIHWVIAADSDSTLYSGSAGWNTTNARWTSNQIETFASTSGATFDLCGVQIELGERATPFEHRSYGDDLARCQRYYQHFTSGGAGTATGASQTQSAQCGVTFSTQMRESPNITIGALTLQTNCNGTVTSYRQNVHGCNIAPTSSASGRQYWHIGLSTASAEY